MAGVFTAGTGVDLHYRGTTDGGAPANDVFVQGDWVATPTGFLFCLTGGPAATATWCDLSEIPSTGIISDVAYDATTWNGVTGVAPSKNAVRDKIEALSAATAPIASPALTGVPTAPNPLPFTRTPQLATTQEVFDSLSSNILPPRLIVPEASLFSAAAAGTWYLINGLTAMRFSMRGSRTYRYVNLRVGVSSGNIQVGVARVRPNSAVAVDLLRVAHSGVIACPGTNTDNQIDLGFFTLTPGDYALFLWCDNTTATFLHSLVTGITASRTTFTGTIAGGLTSAATTLNVTTRWVSGLTLEAASLPMVELGDSIVANDVTGAAGAFFVNADIATGYRFYPITNAGAAGETSTQILARAAAAFAGKRYGLVLAGTNDIGASTPAATIIANLSSIYDAAVAAGLTGFAACTIPPRFESGTTPLSASNAAILSAVNAWIRANYTSWAGATLIDWSWALSDGITESTPKAANFGDHVHPNAVGAAIMSPIIIKSTRDWV